MLSVFCFGLWSEPPCSSDSMSSESDTEDSSGDGKNVKELEQRLEHIAVMYDMYAKYADFIHAKGIKRADDGKETNEEVEHESLKENRVKRREDKEDKSAVEESREFKGLTDKLSEATENARTDIVYDAKSKEEKGGSLVWTRKTN